MKISKDTSNLRKIMVTVPAAVLLLVLYMVIFGFSSQDAEQSGNLSMRISEGAAELLNSLAGNRWNNQELAQYFEHPIRKLAHFSEYACMGVLVYLTWISWIKRGKRLYLLVVVWVFVSAAGDEFHQLFVPGRWGSFADVCLDTCGGAFGLLLCIIASRFGERCKRKKNLTNEA